MYGIIIKLTFENELLFSVKTYVPEVLLAFAVIEAGLSGILRGISRSGIILLCMLGVVFLIGIAVDDTSNAALLLRDVYVPMIFLLLMCSARLSERAGCCFTNILTRMFVTYVICSILIYCVEVTNGYEWTARFYTGYVFWGTDPISRVAVNSNGSIPRLPGLTGSSVKSGLYALVAMIVFLGNEKMRSWRKLSLVMLCLACIVLYNNRSSLLGAVCVLLYIGIRKLPKQKVSRRLNGIIAIGLVIVGFIELMVLLGDRKGVLGFHSVYDRFNTWRRFFSDAGVMKLIIPTNAFSSSAGGTGLSTIWDNSYLYLAFAFGLVVLILFVVILVSYWRRCRLAGTYKYGMHMSSLCRCLLLATAVVGLATNVFQGRSWFFIFVVIFGTAYACMNGAASSAPVADSRMGKR